MIKKLLLMVFGMVFLGITILAQSDEEVKKGMMGRQEAQYKRVLEGQNATNISSKMNISGIIIDDNGNPLNDVELKLVFSRPKGWESDVLKKKITSNSQFSIKQSGYTGLTLYFYKKGYFRETFFYNLMQPSKYQGKDGFIKTDEKVILREIGKQAKLKKFDKKLIYNFKDKTHMICDLSDLTRKTLSINKNIDFPRYIYLDFEQDHDKKIMMIEDEYRGIIPKTIIVRYFSYDKNDGFIIKGTQKNLTYLTSAPDVNYMVKEIKVPYDAAPIYFYYKNGDNYGKGYVGFANSAFQESSVSLHLMQNIETDPKDKMNLRSSAY